MPQRDEVKTKGTKFPSLLKSVISGLELCILLPNDAKLCILLTQNLEINSLGTISYFPQEIKRNFEIRRRKLNRSVLEA